MGTIPLGSSPLARGLLNEFRHEQVEAGIIPARAGFTRRHPVTYQYSPDHPRSRGVYIPVDNVRLWDEGSSPLARGLPSEKEHRRRLAGIIPARAGFTETRAATLVRTPDHPRSRGVYSSTPQGGTEGSGSSPLARGLPVISLTLP